MARRGVQIDPRQKKLLEDIAKVASGLGRTWGVSLTMPNTPRKPYPTLRPRKGPAPAQPSNAVVLENLMKLKWNATPEQADHQQDILASSAALTAKISAELTARFLSRGTFPNVQAMMMAAAIIYRDLVVERFFKQGGDIETPPNSKKWTDYKRKLGLSTKVLTASGQLIKAINKSIPRIVRGGG